MSDESVELQLADIQGDCTKSKLAELIWVHLPIERVEWLLNQYKELVDEFKLMRDDRDLFEAEAQRFVDVIEKIGPCPDEMHLFHPDNSEWSSCGTPHCPGCDSFQCLKCGWWVGSCPCNSEQGNTPSLIVEPTIWKNPPTEVTDGSD